MSRSQEIRDAERTSWHLLSPLSVLLPQVIGQAMLKRWDVVRTCELEPIPTAEGEALQFRLEVLRRGRRFVAKVWRVETHRVQPTFPQRDGNPFSQLADVELLLREEHMSPQREFKTATAALNDAVAALSTQLGVKQRKSSRRRTQRD